MKKIFIFLLILTVAVFCTACINTIAVQKLNELAKQYSDSGDLKTAASRLEASVELDGSVYESRYNLAVAYMNLNECAKALEQISAAELLVQKEPAVFYIKGLANNCLARNIYTKKDENGNEEKIEYDDNIQAVKMASLYINYLKAANEAFEAYIELAPVTDETDSVLNQIASNKKDIEKQKSTYQL